MEKYWNSAITFEEYMAVAKDRIENPVEGDDHNGYYELALQRMERTLKTFKLNPEMLEKLLNKNLVDYLAMDIKSSLERYYKFSRIKFDIKKIQKSVDLVRQAPEYEFRTTVIPLFHDKNELNSIAKWLKGAKKYALQQFRAEKTLDPRCSLLKSYSDEELKNFCQLLQPYFESCELRL